ncbi:MAG: hypothetical protein IKB55_02230, partial [Clostridia bacterium]|nr:hypothetical protein [Clostridia bacterium]
KTYKIIAAVVAVILVIVAGLSVFYDVIRPDIDSPVASWFDDGRETKPFVYTKQIEGGFALYVNETQLVNFGPAIKTYKEYVNFVTGENDVYFIDNNALYWYKIGGKEPVFVADGVDTASVVMSKNGKKILYTHTDGENTVLYSYVAGKSPVMVATLPCAANAFYMPHYGFRGETSKFWYINAESQIDNGELYTADYFGAPQLKYDEIGSVVYYSAKYDALVYTVNKGENIELNMRIGNSEPVLMRTDFSGNAEPMIINAPNEGVAYIGQGNGITNTLFFQPFDGSPAKTIDTGISQIISPQDMTGTAQNRIPYFDHSTFIKETDTICALKGKELVISRGAAAPQTFPGLDPFSAVPYFSDDANTAAYLINGSKLMLTTYDGSTWSNPLTVAESVATFRISKNGKLLAYTVQDANKELSLYMYDVKTGHEQLIVSNALSNIEFDPKSPETIIFATDFNASAQSATAYYYTSGKEAYEISTDITGLTMQSDGIIITKSNPENASLKDFYTLDKAHKLTPIATSAATYNAY